MRGKSANLRGRRGVGCWLLLLSPQANPGLADLVDLAA